MVHIVPEHRLPVRHLRRIAPFVLQVERVGSPLSEALSLPTVPAHKQHVASTERTSPTNTQANSCTTLLKLLYTMSKEDTGAILQESGVIIKLVRVTYLGGFHRRCCSGGARALRPRRRRLHLERRRWTRGRLGDMATAVPEKLLATHLPLLSFLRAIPAS